MGAHAVNEQRTRSFESAPCPRGHGRIMLELRLTPYRATPRRGRVGTARTLTSEFVLTFTACAPLPTLRVRASKWPNDKGAVWRPCSAFQNDRPALIAPQVTAAPNSRCGLTARPNTKPASDWLDRDRCGARRSPLTSAGIRSRRLLPDRDARACRRGGASSRSGGWRDPVPRDRHRRHGSAG